jgi:hypothetical protein
MRTSDEFNEKYKEFLEEGHYGMDINIPAVLSYVDVIFSDLTKIKGFQYSQIKIKYGMSRVYTNLQETLPYVSRILEQELEEKINFILKVEYELENRLKSLNLDRDGKAISAI